MKSLLLDFLKVTESAAIAVMPWIGSGDKIAADRAATDMMRQQFNNINMNGVVVIGEGEIDHAPMLFIGEKVGSGKGPHVDIAVDPVEGTTPAVNGQINAITVAAIAPKDTLLHAPDIYMEKLVVGPKAKGKINIEMPLLDNMRAIAKASGKQVNELNVFVQDRPRHESYIHTIRNAGAKAHLFAEGDVIYALATCMPKEDIDLFIGIGGAPEGVISAVAIKCLGGEMQAKLLPRNTEEEARCLDMGLENPADVLTHDQLISSDDCLFIATGITDNLLLKGIKKYKGYYTTQSLLMNGVGSQLQYIESQHEIR